MAIFGKAARSYVAAGWPVLPCHPDSKSPAIRDVTGYDGVDLSGEALDRAIIQYADNPIGLRMPVGVLGIDVDAHDGRPGGKTLAALEKKLGSLPLSPLNTARPGTGSGHRFFRVPAGFQARDLEGIEMLQRHHRLAVAFPSLNPKNGEQYRWYSPEGEPLRQIPSPETLNELPQAWLEYLKKPERIVTDPTPNVEVTPRIQQWSVREVTKLAKKAGAASRGERNNKLNKFAFLAGRIIARGGITHDEAFDLFEKAVEGWDADAAGTTYNTLDHGLTDGLKDPYEPWPPPLRTQDYFGLSDRMVEDYFPDHIYWLTDAELWATWDGKKWVRDNGETTGRLYRDMVERMPDDEVDDYSAAPKSQNGKPGPSDYDKHMDWIAGLRNPQSRGSTLSQMKSDSFDQTTNFDTNLDLIGLQDGVWDFNLNIFRGFDPADRITKMMSFKYDPSATCPNWEKALESWQPDPRDVHYLGKALAYSMLGRPVLKRFFILHGKTNTGKTTLIKTIQAMFGNQYATKLKSNAIYTKDRGDQGYNIDPARGKRFVSVSEPDGHNIIDASTVKDFSGNGFMVSRNLYQGDSEWKPEAVLWVDANNLPTVSEEETDIWPRIKVINFPVQFSDDPTTPPELRIDPTLETRLLAELPGIFNWLLKKLEAFRAEGLTEEPPSIIKASNKYRAQMDTIAEFFGEQFDLGLYEEGEELFMEKKDVFPDYVKWCNRQGEGYQALGKMKFNDRVSSMFKEHRRTGKPGWKGFSYKQSAAESIKPVSSEQGNRAPFGSIDYSSEKPATMTFEQMMNFED